MEDIEKFLFQKQDFDLERVSQMALSDKDILQKLIIQILLDVDQTKRDPERIDLLKADVIQSFEEIFDTSKQKKKILAFVEKQVDCASPKTQKVAKEFLSKYKATEVGK